MWKVKPREVSSFVSIFVSRAGKVTIFTAKMVTFSAHDTNLYKSYKLHRTIGPLLRDFVFLA